MFDHNVWSIYEPWKLSDVNFNGQASNNIIFSFGMLSFWRSTLSIYKLFYTLWLHIQPRYKKFSIGKNNYCSLILFNVIATFVKHPKKYKVPNTFICFTHFHTILLCQKSWNMYIPQSDVRHYTLYIFENKRCKHFRYLLTRI